MVVGLNIVLYDMIVTLHSAQSYTGTEIRVELFYLLI